MEVVYMFIGREREISALNKLYKSNTFAKIEDPQTGLYYQGAVYVFDFLKEEFSK